MQGRLAEGRTSAWHSIEKLGWELGLRHQQEEAQLKVAAFLQGIGVEATASMRGVDIRSDAGDVVLVRNLLGVPSLAGPPVKLYEQDRSSHMLRVVVGAQGLLDGSRCRLTELNLDEHVTAIHARAGPR